MPKLNGYRSQVGVATARNTARMPFEDPTARALEGLGGTVQEAGGFLEKRFEQREISKMNAEVAKTSAELTVQLREELAQADPNDDQFAERFMQERVGGRISQLKDSARSPAARRFVNEATALMYGQLLTSSDAGQISLASTAAVANFQTSLNELSSGANADPSTMDYSIEQGASAIDAMVAAGSLDRENAIKLKTQSQAAIAKSAVRGWIELNPYRAKDMIQEGRFDSRINGEEKAVLTDQADTAIRAREVEERRIQAEAKQAELDASHQKLNAYIPDIVQNKVSAMDVATDPTLRQEEKRIALSMIESQSSGKEFKTDPGTYISLFRRVHAGVDDPDRITDPTDLDYYFGRGLNAESLQTLRNELTGTRTEAGRIRAEQRTALLNTAQSALTATNQLTGVRDPKGDEQYAKFLFWFNQEYTEQIENGATPMELLDPDSPKSLYKGVGQFRRSVAQQMSDLLSNDLVETPEVPPAEKTYGTANEVVQDYQAGKITRDKASAILKANGWAE